jgi:hypothetical protein
VVLEVKMQRVDCHVVKTKSDLFIWNSTERIIRIFAIEINNKFSKGMIGPKLLYRVD